MVESGMNLRWDARSRGKATVMFVLCALCLMARAEDIPRAASSSALDRGFAGHYNLDFAGAEKDFVSWQKQHPDDPMGPVSEAAGFLFSEFNRLGVLEAQFYENDANFTGQPKFIPDPGVRQVFLNA